ncbi:SDR family oxidoreductase [Psychromarinibacter sp. C21-152]|uniref:SDR family oxidoreductase n=1 Tax=Psychromarinibacter sediminicola TaxID=3033385 RepID=A0AAE3NQE1_9RHOB|nr:SDR family oxidoreductase [Psychromarinibacter sediminicola]MDF0599759.1 SDR family oxidoreductase [Psychromarinibacter sediminicola]
MQIALTGAASGIGAATVGRLKAAGHHVTAFDIAEPAGVDRWLPVDLSDMDAIADATAQVAGPFDALILNAGLPPRADNAVELLTVNVFGLMAAARALEPKLAPGASIVATASRAGEHWRQNLPQVKALMGLTGPAALPDFVAANQIDPLRAYCLSKEAVVVWTLRQTERLLAKNMRANCVSPSAVDTPILGDFKAALGERAAHSLARVGRAGQPDEIAALIAFLAGPESGWVRGQNVTVDGGMTAMALCDELGLG